MTIELRAVEARVAVLWATPSFWNPNFSTMRRLGSFLPNYPIVIACAPRWPNAYRIAAFAASVAIPCPAYLGATQYPVS
jgi:hypothetical protein